MFHAMATFPFSAVLLAAGYSTRMGQDKALLEVESQPLWQRQRDVLAAAGASEIFLSARPEQSWTRRATGFHALLHDALPSSGPLAGITAALERATHEHVAVLAIDLPRLKPEWFATLLDACGPHCGVVGRCGGHFEPLAAIYPRALMHHAWQALAAGNNSLQTLLTCAVAEGLMRVHEIGAAEAEWFTNWNEPEDVGPLRSGR